MKRSVLKMFLAASVTVLGLGVSPLHAEQPTTEQLIQKLDQLQSQLAALEAKVQMLEGKKLDVSSPVADATPIDAVEEMAIRPAPEAIEEAIAEVAIEEVAVEEVAEVDAATPEESIAQVEVIEQPSEQPAVVEIVVASDEIQVEVAEVVESAEIQEADVAVAEVDGAQAVQAATTQPSAVSTNDNATELEGDQAASDPSVVKVEQSTNDEVQLTGLDS